jgi:hypothetical protein
MNGLGGGPKVAGRDRSRRRSKGEDAHHAATCSTGRALLGGTPVVYAVAFFSTSNRARSSEPGTFAAFRAEAMSRWIDFEETIAPHRAHFLRRLAGRQP